MTVALVGTVLDGRYRVEGLLGEGGMGAVYSATDLRLEKRVAAKVMARELADNPEALARFHREARVTSGLGHPHIVQVFDFSTTPSGEPFMVMEFLEGEDLDRRLRRVRQLPASRVVHIIKQVASVLAATHAKTIVHRDLKPGNIYLLEAAGEPDFVKVLDFGISKVRSANTRITRTASVMGTPNYMSPEQARGKVDEIDERTDQWALACIAWECLSGEGPFLGENVPSILFQIVHEPPPALLPKVNGLHPHVEDVLLRALAKDKNERFPDINDFAEALAAAVTCSSQVKVTKTSAAVPHGTMLLSDSSDPLPDSRVSLQSTFAQTAGAVMDMPHKPPERPRWIWGIAGVAVSALSFATYLLLRPSPFGEPTPMRARPTTSAPIAPVAPPPAPRGDLTTAPPEPPLVPSPSAAAALEQTPRRVHVPAAPGVDGRRKKGRRKAADGPKAEKPSAPVGPEPPTVATVTSPQNRSRLNEEKAKKPFGVPPSGPNEPLDKINKQADSAKPAKTRSKEDRWRVE